ncbi:hypothetical protein DFH06DRAFT_1297212 [Mycena polygramma]|nr:hypothetical protein DFH06DRAFT_1297212 [Mycena polygramma]
MSYVVGAADAAEERDLSAAEATKSSGTRHSAAKSQGVAKDATSVRRVRRPVLYCSGSGGLSQTGSRTRHGIRWRRGMGVACTACPGIGARWEVGGKGRRRERKEGDERGQREEDPPSRCAKFDGGVPYTRVSHDSLPGKEPGSEMRTRDALENETRTCMPKPTRSTFPRDRRMSALMFTQVGPEERGEFLCGGIFRQARDRASSVQQCLVNRITQKRVGRAAQPVEWRLGDIQKQFREQARLYGLDAADAAAGRREQEEGVAVRLLPHGWLERRANNAKVLGSTPTMAITHGLQIFSRSVGDALLTDSYTTTKPSRGFHRHAMRQSSACQIQLLYNIVGPSANFQEQCLDTKFKRAPDEFYC